MSVCKACSFTISNGEEVKCHLCLNTLHLGCSKLAEENHSTPTSVSNSLRSCIVCPIEQNESEPNAAGESETVEVSKGSRQESRAYSMQQTFPTLHNFSGQAADDNHSQASNHSELVSMETGSEKEYKVKDFFFWHPKNPRNINEPQRATCVLCHPSVTSTKIVPPSFSYVVSNGSTKSLKYHLEKRHPFEHSQIKKTPATEKIKTELKIREPTFITTQSDLVNQVMLWIIRTGQPFTVVDDPVFRNILDGFFSRLIGGSSSRMFPSSEHFRKQLKTTHQESEQVKVSEFDKLDSKIAISTDIWTSANCESFIGFTSHWIDSNFVIKKQLLAFLPLPERHTSVDILSKYNEIVSKYRLDSKISTITLDNASSNTSFITLLSEAKKNRRSFFDFKENFHIRCIAHVFHLAAQSLILGVEGKLLLVDPPIQAFIIEGFHELTILQGSIDKMDCKATSGRSKVAHNKAPGIIAILRGELKTILRNENLMALLFNAQLNLGLEASSPKLDVKTRWNSTYYMIIWALKNKEALLETLPRSDANQISWEKFERLVEILGLFSTMTQHISPKKSCTLATALDGIADIENQISATLRTMDATDALYEPLLITYSKISEYKKYYTEDIFLVAIVLDPAYKLRYISEKFPMLLTKATKAIYSLFVEYASAEEPSNKRARIEPEAMSRREMFVFNQMSTQAPSKEGELAVYLNTASTDCPILRFWKENSKTYPTLSKMARDIYASQATSAASEREFHCAVNILGIRRHHMEKEPSKSLKEAQATLLEESEIILV